MDAYLSFVRFCIDPDTPIPNITDWKGLFKFMNQQALLGVGFKGLEKMSAAGVKVPKEVVMQWFMLSEKIKDRNKRMNKAVVDVFDLIEKDGYESVLLKGQGNNISYPDPYTRTSGDIDIWMNATREDIIKFAKSHFKMEEDIRYHHVECEYNGVPVELHVFPSTMNNPMYNGKLQKWFKEKVGEQFKHNVHLPDGVGSVPVPTAPFNLIFQLSHMYHHFFDEGIGLRQMMDYYYVIKASKQDSSNYHDNLIKDLKNLNLYHFEGAVMYVLHKVFGLSDAEFLVPIDEKRGKLLMDEILKGGNFGKYSGLTDHTQGAKYFLKIKRNMRFVRYYSEEALCEPLFRTWHWGWRLFVKQ